jgi:uncharacterized iron-regulated membrane protein
MKSSKNIFARTPRYESKEEPEYLLRSAHAFWRTMILVLFGVLVCAIIFGAYVLSTSTSTINASAETAVPQPQLLSETELSATVANLEARERLFQMFRSATTSAADPSR